MTDDNTVEVTVRFRDLDKKIVGDVDVVPSHPDGTLNNNAVNTTRAISIPIAFLFTVTSRFRISNYSFLLQSWQHLPGKSGPSLYCMDE